MGQSAATRTHDFPGDSAGKAIPYGVYDVTANAGWVNAVTGHDTARVRGGVDSVLRADPAAPSRTHADLLCRQWVRLWWVRLMCCPRRVRLRGDRPP